MKKTNRKITSKEYIAKYVYLKMLFGEYKIGEFIPSESMMAKYFNTTNLTIRSAYSILISNGLIKPIMGKGYQIIIDPIEHLWPFISKVNKWENKTKIINDYIEIIFKNDDKELVSKWFINEKIQISNADMLHTIRNIFNKRFNIDNFFNLTIINNFDYCDNTLTINTSFKDNDNNSLLFVATSCNIKWIDYFFSNIKQIKII